MAEKALSGLKVLDFTRVYAGPYCTMMLADLGADVIKVEFAGRGDDSRRFFPVRNGESGYFMYLNRGKRSITLNLKSEEGHAAALELAKWADVLVENFSPGTMARLGLAYEDVIKVNPEIIYGSISGFGQTGPYSFKKAYDGITQVMGGMAYLTGDPNGTPMKVGPAISDSSTGIHMAVAILSAVYYKGRTGKGQYIDMAMMDTIFSLLENFVPIKTMTGQEPHRVGNGNPFSAPYGQYRTKDDYIVIACANNALFHALTGVMGREDLRDDPRFLQNDERKMHEREIDAEVEKWTLQHTTAEIEAMLNDAGVPVGVVKSVDDLIHDPQIAHREMLVEHDHPRAGRIKFPGNPMKLRETPPDPTRRAPVLGEHTDEILGEVLGMDEAQIAQYHEENIV